METSIQISRKLLKALKKMKMFEKESYENVIWDLIEDRLEFSERTKKNITQSEKEISKGETVSLEDVKKRL